MVTIAHKLMDKIIKVAILGASGYTGLELIRLVSGHPGMELCGITSRTNAGKKLSEVFPRFAGSRFAEVPFVLPDAIKSLGVDAAFLALPHGKAAKYAMELLETGAKVFDLSADFRLRELSVYEEFYGEHPAPELLKKAVYGMPELYRAEIAKADLIASPGCYPTSIILPLIPLLQQGLIDASTIQAFSMSGVSGAGRKESIPLLFCEANESVRAYGIPKHRHLSEIEQELSFAAGEPVTISFLPHLVPVQTGIASTISATLTGDWAQVGKALEKAYADATFVRLLGEGQCADTKHVTRTNFLDIGWHYDERTNRVFLTSAEDNVVKGASGQAIHSFNLKFGFAADCGLTAF